MMPTIDETIATILEERDSAVSKIHQAFVQMNAAKIAIISGMGAGGPTDAEKLKIATLDSGMDQLQKADSALALSAVADLNSSAAATALESSLTDINTALGAQVNDIKKVSATITAIGTAAKKIDGILQTAITLVGLFP
jgi:hypothetical protein